MPNIGPMEIAIVLIIALVIFGPKKLPELGRSAGNGLRELKSSLDGSDGQPEPIVVDNTTTDNKTEKAQTTSA